MEERKANLQLKLIRANLLKSPQFKKKNNVQS